MNYLIRNKSVSALKLNESIDSNGKKKYIFEGIFTPINAATGKKNRNGRIYDKDEVLKHIAYLRDRIKTDGAILGELSHPESRFEIDLKGVSHKITDLWYDERRQAVMGKLELLDTPNGNIVKALVEAECPVFVSSRAAGTVGADSHVHIQQMFTYDIVATPGFEEARLNRVNESIRPSVTAFLNESAQASKKLINLSSKFSIDASNTIIEEVDEEIKFTKNNMTNINEEEVKQPLTSKTAVPEQIDGSDAANAMGIPTPELGPVAEDGEPSETSEAGTEEPKGNSEDADLIIEIEPQFASDIISVEAEFKEDKKEEEEKPEEEEKEDDDKKEDEPTEEVKESKDKKEETLKEINLAKADDIKKRNEETLNKYDNIIKDLKTKKAVKESIVELYPFAISLSESNFSKFACLLDDDKAKVADFIYSNAIIDVNAINESWDTPLKEKVRNKNKWMQLASEEDKKLFNEAPKEIQDSITESAKFFDIRTKADVDTFWANTGLRQMRQQAMLNESFVNEYKDMVNPINPDNELPYTANYVKFIEELI